MCDYGKWAGRKTGNGVRQGQSGGSAFHGLFPYSLPGRHCHGSGCKSAINARLRRVEEPPLAERMFYQLAEDGLVVPDQDSRVRLGVPVVPALELQLAICRHCHDESRHQVVEHTLMQSQHFLTGPIHNVLYSVICGVMCCLSSSQDQQSLASWRGQAKFAHGGARSTLHN